MQSASLIPSPCFGLSDKKVAGLSAARKADQMTNASATVSTARLSFGGRWPLVRCSQIILNSPSASPWPRSYCRGSLRLRPRRRSAAYGPLSSSPVCG
jgi:hypothetical protein